MKIRYFMVYLLLFLGVGASGMLMIQKAGRIEEDKILAADPLAVSRLLFDIGENWEEISQGGARQAAAFPSGEGLDYAVLGPERQVLIVQGEKVSTDIARATRHGDVIRDIEADGAVVGKLIIYNTVYAQLERRSRRAMWFFGALCGVNALMILFFTGTVYRNIISPFQKMERFAAGVAAGNLDIRLERDKNNMFGAFTESFDVMREELLLAREREAQAKRSRKELVAELSHDIKTPVASIKALSEVMELTAGEKEREALSSIIKKADQIDQLVTNLFHATLEELEQLSVSIEELDSRQLIQCIRESDFQGRIREASLPDCIILGDRLRIEQVVGNILTNSYKYADTAIEVTGGIRQESGRRMLWIALRDFGPGVEPEELETVTLKFRRGSNAGGEKGSGLGLYLSKYLCEKMQGYLLCENKEPGFCVTVVLPLA